MARTPKPLNIGGSNSDSAPSSPPVATGRTPRPLQIETPPAPVSPSPSSAGGGRTPKGITVPTPATPSRNGPPRELNVGNQRSGGKVDGMLARAFDIDATMERFKFRLKPRFDDLLATPTDQYINWGERNLVALRGVTAKQAALATKVSAIDAPGWIERTGEAANRKPGFLDRFTRPEPPAYYQAKVQQVRDELNRMIPELSALHAEIAPDAEDLRMDIMALQVVVETMENVSHANMASNRVTTLVAGQQTVVMAMLAIEQLQTVCANYIQTIDQLLTITIPNWQIAEQAR